MTRPQFTTYALKARVPKRFVKEWRALEAVAVKNKLAAPKGTRANACSRAPCNCKCGHDARSHEGPVDVGQRCLVAHCKCCGFEPVGPWQSMATSTDECKATVHGESQIDRNMEVYEKVYVAAFRAADGAMSKIEALPAHEGKASNRWETQLNLRHTLADRLFDRFFADQLAHLEAKAKEKSLTGAVEVAGQIAAGIRR